MTSKCQVDIEFSWRRRHNSLNAPQADGVSAVRPAKPFGAVGLYGAKAPPSRRQMIRRPGPFGLRSLPRMPLLEPRPHRYRRLRTRGLRARLDHPCRTVAMSRAPVDPALSSDRDLLRQSTAASILASGPEAIRPPMCVRRCGGRHLRGNPPQDCGSSTVVTARLRASGAPLQRVPQVPACHDPARAGGGIGLRRNSKGSRSWLLLDT